MDESGDKRSRHVLLVGFPGFGHFIPMITLAVKLVPHHHVTLAVSQSILPNLRKRGLITAQYEQTITVVGIEDGVPEGLGEDTVPNNNWIYMYDHILPSIAKFIQNLPIRSDGGSSGGRPVDIVIGDPFVATGLSACVERRIPYYLFCTCPAGPFRKLIYITDDTLVDANAPTALDIRPASDGKIMMSDEEEEVPDGTQLLPVAPAQKPAPKITRLHWKEQDEEKLFRQYRVYLDEYEGREAEMWTQIYNDLVFAGVPVVSVRPAKEWCSKTLKEFRASDVLDRWKTGDPGQFTEWERLLCDICNHLDDKKKRVTQGSQKKTAEQEKQLRKDAKMMHAASHSLKKRKKGPTPTLLPKSDDTVDTSSGELDGDLANVSQRERTSYNHCISEFLTSNKTSRNRQLKIDEDRLAFEKAKEKREETESAHRMLMDRERVELEKKREENATLMAQNAALMAQTLAQALITIQTVKNSSV